MRLVRIFLVGLCAVSAATTGEAAFARGCIKGAIIGGTIGHFAGRHGVLGAVAGCLYGRHHAHEPQKKSHPQYGAPQHNPAPQPDPQLEAPRHDERAGGVEV